MIHSINPQSSEAEPEDCAGNSRPETTGRHTAGRPLDGVLESSQHSLPPAVDTERFGGRGSPPPQWSGWGWEVGELLPLWNGLAPRSKLPFSTFSRGKQGNSLPPGNGFAP